jgi:transposase
MAASRAGEATMSRRNPPAGRELPAKAEVPGRGDLTDEEWAVIAPLLPAERGRANRPALDNRPFVNGILWIASTGAPWRELPARYGKWNSVYQRFRRWSMAGVWGGVVRKLTGFGFVDGGHRILAAAAARAQRRVAARPRAARARRAKAGGASRR